MCASILGGHWQCTALHKKPLQLCVLHGIANGCQPSVDAVFPVAAVTGRVTVASMWTAMKAVSTAGSERQSTADPLVVRHETAGVVVRTTECTIRTYDIARRRSNHFSGHLTFYRRRTDRSGWRCGGDRHAN